MTNENQNRWLIRLSLVGLILLFLFLTFQYVLTVLLPFLVAIVFAVSLQKPLVFLTKHTPVPKAVWSLLLVGGISALLFWGVIYGSTVLYDRVFWLIEQAASLAPLFKERISSVLERFSDCTRKLPPAFVEQLQTTPAQIATKAVSLATERLTRLAGALLEGLPSLLVTSVVTVAACFFVTADYTRITAFVMRHSPSHVQTALLETKRVFTQRIFALLRGYSLLMGITFLELFFGFLILKIPYASTLALLVAVVDILPVLGTGTVLLPWGFIALFLGNTTMGTGIFALYILITVIRNLLEPKILGKQIGLPPLVTLIAMYAGLKLFGFVGLLGVPLLLMIGLHFYQKKGELL